MSDSPTIIFHAPQARFIKKDRFRLKPVFFGGTAASQLELIIRDTYCFIVVSKKIGM